MFQMKITYEEARDYFVKTENLITFYHKAS